MDLIKFAMDDYKKMVDTGDIRDFTPYEVNSIWFILKDLSEGNESGTLSYKVSKWFSNHGFSAAENGIGWLIRM